MSRLIDPRICPDCRAALDTTGTCTRCALQLTGPVAAELWATMQVADGLIERLRAEAGARAGVGAGVGAGVSARVGAGLPRTADLPTAPPPPPVRRGPRLGAGSVPAVLFGVGALCLLVAAVVFVAVAWSSLGLGARTTILLAVTGAFAATATRLTLRGLRGAAETFWVVVGALVTIDLLAAHAAGLLGFDGLSSRHAVAVLGGALLGLGLVVGSWARRTELPALVAPTVISTAGAALLAATEGWAAPSTAVGSCVAILGLTGLAMAARLLGLTPTAYAAGGLGALSWTVLLAAGLDRASEVGAATWWTHLAGWPLLAAVLIAAVPALVATVPQPLRTVAATASELALILLVVGPGASADTEVVVLSALAVALAGASLVVPRTWSVPAACYAGVAGVVAASYAVVRPVLALSGLPTTGPADSANLDQHLAGSTGELAGWTAIVIAVVVVLVGLALVRWIPDPAVRLAAERGWQVLAPTVVALGVVTAFLETGPALLPAVLAWSAVLAVLAVLALVVPGAPGAAVLAVAGYLGVVGLRLAVPSHLLAAVLATALATGLAIGYRRTAADRFTRAACGVATLVAAGFAATHGPYLLGGTGDAAGLTLAALAALAGLLAARVARAGDRPVLEIAALLLGLAAVAFPVDESVVTLVLTLVGSAVALVSVLHRDRDQVAWLGTAVLAVAALLRVLHQLSLPELATAPAAALLLLAGTRRLLRDPDVSSLRALGSGLSLALLPTLLLCLDEPVSVRGALAAAGAVLVLAAGVTRRWAAPFLAGAGAVAVLAVRHLGPVAEALPRWISLGVLGIGLLVVAVTWESRRRQLEGAERYLAALR